MINVHRIKGLNIDAPLPRLVYDEAEARIAQIPGWEWFVTPHASWYNGDAGTVKERVNGTSFMPLGTDNSYWAKLGTFDDGSLSFDFGYANNTGMTSYKTGMKFKDAMTFFMVGKMASDVNAGGARYLFRCRHDANLMAEKMAQYAEPANPAPLAFGFNNSGIPTLYREWGSGSSTNMVIARTATAYSYESFKGKLCFLMVTFEVGSDAHIYINGVNQDIT